MDEHFLPTPSPSKTLELIETEWDEVADLRRQQLKQGEDLSFLHILTPAVFALLTGSNLRRVVDLGCGTGTLTAMLAEKSGEVVGVDLSSRSIGIAEEDIGGRNNVRFYAGTVERFAQEGRQPAFTAAVANMTLMDCLDLNGFLQATSQLLVDGGCFVATITHPCFWPRYWGYESAEWFDYSQEIYVESPFRISTHVSRHTTTHVHRPLSSYLNALTGYGLLVDRVTEPVPDKLVEGLFPSPWEYPRFLAIRAHKSPR